jgi:hypothetical protein
MLWTSKPCFRFAFGFPDDYMDNETNPDALDFETLLQVCKFTLKLVNISIF